MKYDPDRHHRRSFRLRGYNYATPGAYFVTVCVQNRVCLFGDVGDGVMWLNDSGRMIQTTWEAMPHRFPTIELDAFVVMPNHFHAIVTLHPRCIDSIGETSSSRGRIDMETSMTQQTMTSIVGAFKSITTHAYIDGVRNNDWPPFERRLWQRNYWEHVVRGEGELGRLRAYINTNPSRWRDDQLYIASSVLPM